MSELNRKGFGSVPTRSLAEQLRLLQLILEGMAKHKVDADYPTLLDTFGLAALQNDAGDVATKASAAKASFHKAIADAEAERTRVGVELEKVHNQLQASYGRRNPILLDYGFRPIVDRPHKKRTAAEVKGGKSRGKAAGASGATAGEPSKGTTPPSPTGSPGA